MAKPSIGALQDELKARDKRIAELRDELDETRELVKRMEEQIEDAHRVIERWCEAFEMEQTADGDWTYTPWVDTCLKLREEHQAMVRQWNQFVPQYNAAVAPRRRNVGRPLAASDVQQEQVLKLRKHGMSLRDIAEETSLGLRTVCTIVDKGTGADRTSVKHLQRIAPDRAAILRDRSMARAIKALPQQINATLEAGHDLLKEAKGRKKSGPQAAKV
jgi:hypothetical protein